MKRNILFLSLVGILFLTASCVQPDIDSQIKLQPESGPALFTATINNPQTKVQLSEDGEGVHVLWSPADKITLFYGGGVSGAEFTSTNSEPSATAEFTGTLPIAVEGNTDFNYYAVYPYHGKDKEGMTNDKFENGQIKPQLNQSQIYPNAGSFSYDANVLGTGAVFVGKAETHDIKFYNVCSFFRFKVTRDDVIRVDFEGKDNEKICGGFSVQFNATTGLPEVVVPERANSAGGKSGAVSLRFTNAYTQCFEPGLWYYLTLLPTTFTHGATVTVYTKTGKVTRSIAGPITFAQNQYRSIASIDTGITFDDNFTTDLTLNGSSVSATTLWPHGTATLVPVVNAILPGGNHRIPDITWTWASDHPEFAKVSNKGVVTGVAAGTAEITATTTLNGTSHSLSCTVTVTEADSQLEAKTFVVDEHGTQVYFAPGNLYTSDGGTTFEFHSYQGQIYSYNIWNASSRDKFKWDEIKEPLTISGSDNKWKCLSENQWAYFLTRPNSFAKATVNGIPGLILLPDGYEDLAALKGINEGGVVFSTNYLCGAEWTQMELNGAIFLPAAGFYDAISSTFSGVGSNGQYWSCTFKSHNETDPNKDSAHRFYFDNSSVKMGSNYARRYFPIRLVRFVNE